MERLVRGLDLGVNDYLIRPVDQNELMARCRTQLRRKKYEDRLRANYHLSMTLAVTDPLTGLYNRRYLESHLENLMQRAVHDDKPVGLMALDIGHFKMVNDTHGHATGDEALKEFAARVKRCVRFIDLAARTGGEEFVVVMPDSTRETCMAVAERLREAIAEAPVNYPTRICKYPLPSVSVSACRKAPPTDRRTFFAVVMTRFKQPRTQAATGLSLMNPIRPPPRPKAVRRLGG